MLRPIKITKPIVNKPQLRKRYITVRAFWERVGESKYAELIELAKQDAVLTARLSMINGSSYIDLDYSSLREAFTALREAGVFTPQDEDRIFANSTPEEEPSNIILL